MTISQSSSQSSDTPADAFLPDRAASLKAGLYLIATPIGNLADITLRALQIMQSLDILLCEDTRHSGKLLKYYNINVPTRSYHDHSTQKDRDDILSMLAAGKKIGLISDAGMPLISDPGYKLVRDARAAGHYVTTCPGANAVLSAIQLSGFASDKFSFLGFLPAKAQARVKELQSYHAAGDQAASQSPAPSQILGPLPGLLVFYESASRLRDMLRDCQTVFGGQRRVAVIRELTKIYEETIAGPLDDVIAQIDQRGGVKGEIVVVIDKAPDIIWDQATIIAHLTAAIHDQNMSVKTATQHVHTQSQGWRKKDIYELALGV